MGLFGRKTDYLSEMRECLKHYMVGYIKENPESSDTVAPIFSAAEELVRTLKERQVRKEIEKHGFPVDYLVLNIINNVAMTELRPTSLRDMMFGENYAHDLYRYANLAKFEKGYISKKQYDENEALAFRIMDNSPL